MNKIQDVPSKISDIDHSIYFNKVYSNNFSQLCANVSHLLPDNLAAEDVVQEVFISIWNKKILLQDINNIKSYLTRAVRNRSLNYLRGRKEIFKDSFSENCKIQDLDSESEQDEKLKTIRLAIDALPIKCKQVFLMSKYDSKKYKDIAVELGKSVKTVENQVSMALKQINLYVKENV